ncbi:MAG: methylenetetrahydrofolate--tRNA-(uracil(54)-C(5))-methyltransferase (FADH(2)-oxidizing) TrmFO [Desulfarculaceae bacterium]|nr:methylenetetrahydrofolate--tRNA-(uracil(54)-C(5))-methyltransferase (FADH(2)-oxidizing) TrmFO [Desulfarculaceae bacterium]MCF8073622.1 methylenetetrahydrofolate--tRNA-(uracil(54)-C(5))-methyltransferase (FADH(2)-oxidizing) TrmFO [Desulfarculaceae bacterium]MCF8103146.1 methylenetetrahydrofolate--tRNA-(uracil(54)-C(5))-methyltransferase (FADH(2)-oxidizing) TrmFO [Desulfarculaceae bacterium]MCF8115662.1 methylenetetrahydrofolate--tRNA-(uracil(54)-C(5))-methyltransferase (FADH(2)-oxidizing) TrmF
MAQELLVIGGGLAGCEAALAAARFGAKVTLVEMKPAEFTPAHHSPRLGELVCSNSLRSAQVTSAVGLLKAEMAIMGSAMIKAARATAVGAGKALAVDRERFAQHMEAQIEAEPNISRETRRVDQLPTTPAILATGPLTTEGLAEVLGKATSSDHLHFYDAIAPIVTLDTVDMSSAYWGDRYGEPGEGDYLNCPLSKGEYERFYAALTSGAQVPLKDFENPRFFEGCLPIEVMAARGEKTLLFGPMKPVGLDDPRTGRWPHAVVQLRKENRDGTMLNLVGFQTKLTYEAQNQVLRLIPALASAEFVRWGSIHRNTFLDAPRVLDPNQRLLAYPHLFVAGQLSGVEGYVESAAMGMLCGINATRLMHKEALLTPPPTTALGGLVTHLQNKATKDFQPSNVNFGLLPPLEEKVYKKQRGAAQARRALADLMAWLKTEGLSPQEPPPPIPEVSYSKNKKKS